MNKESYAYLVRISICPRCRRKVYDRHTYCEICRAYMAEKGIEYYRNESVERKRIRNKRERSLYQQRKNAGMCVKCGKRPAKQGHSLCQRCMAYKREKQSLYRYKSRGLTYKQRGLCTRCGGVRKDGYNLCEECHGQQVEHNRQIDRTNHYWRKLNNATFSIGQN